MRISYGRASSAKAWAPARELSRGIGSGDTGPRVLYRAEIGSRRSEPTWSYLPPR
jgi:hypothetical protein